jgi:SAM-dependent methyltransferase
VTDDDLLRHYLERGGPDSRWNLSAEAAYFDYRTRDFLERHAERSMPYEVCNVGIGVGLWDDFLAYWVGETGRVVSIDIDPQVAMLLRTRQARENHPHACEVVCTDALGDGVRRGTFDLVTVVGATPSESGDPHGLIAAAVGLARPGGQVMIGGLEELVPLGALDRWLGELSIDDMIVDEDRRFPSLPFHLVVARVTAAASSRVL